MRSAVLDTQHGRHVVDDIVKAGAKMEGRPIQKPDAAVGCEVDVANMRIAMQEGAESRVALGVVAIQCLIASLTVHEVFG